MRENKVGQKVITVKKLVLLHQELKGAQAFGQMAAFAGLLATTFASSHNNDEGYSVLKQVQSEPSEDLNANIKVAALDKTEQNESAACVLDEMPVWNFVKKLDTKMSMTEILADSRVSEYLDSNSNVKFDSSIAFSSIKSELLDDGGFKGAFEMAPEAKTINDYLKVISEKDSGLAARMKAEFQMFGLKNPAELNAIVKKVVEDSTK